MTSLATNKRNTSTGIHFLQRSGNKFKYRVCQDSIKRWLSVEVKTEYLVQFTKHKDGVHHSLRFDTIEEGTADLIQFLYKLTGVRCTA